MPAVVKAIVKLQTHPHTLMLGNHPTLNSRTSMIPLHQEVTPVIAIVVAGIEETVTHRLLSTKTTPVVAPLSQNDTIVLPIVPRTDIVLKMKIKNINHPSGNTNHHLLIVINTQATIKLVLSEWIHRILTIPPFHQHQHYHHHVTITIATIILTCLSLNILLFLAIQVLAPTMANFSHIQTSITFCMGILVNTCINLVVPTCTTIKVLITKVLTMKDSTRTDGNKVPVVRIAVQRVCLRRTSSNTTITITPIFLVIIKILLQSTMFYQILPTTLECQLIFHRVYLIP